ncbi:MAG: HD domain-containing protein [Defluviitaleaceae bacterium]|nr:HD domain-containing protein [Defluviitaleaceae bacterium]
MTKKLQTAAVIDIGSNELRLHIAQSTDADTIHYLENLNYPLSLGRDTFHMGKISFEKVDKACEVIKGFLNVIKGYGIRHVYTIACTAIREAANRDYVLDQIKIKTGIDVHVMDDLEEKRHIYKLLTYYADDYLKKSAVMVYIGTGSIGVNLYIDGKMPRTWNIRVGSLRMSEMFGNLQDVTRDFYRLMEEYLAGYIYKLEAELPAGIRNFIVSGQEGGLISELVMHENEDFLHGKPLYGIERGVFDSFYEKIKHQTVDRIVNDYDIAVDKAEMVLPAACICQKLLGCTDAKTIIASRLLPCDSILFEMLYPKKFADVDKRFENDTILSAKELAQRYGANIAHGKIVCDYADTIFSKIKKLHGLGVRDRVLLETAAYLHDIGEYINSLDHHLISYEMVKRSDIVGLTQAEQEIVALICRFHSGTPDLKSFYYNVIPTETKVRVSKLAAMLRLADSIDRSHTQKKIEIDVKLLDDALLITVHTGENYTLEKWAFAEKSRFFEDVFGIKAELYLNKTGCRT